VAREFEDLEEIQGILSSGSFEELKGTLENEFFEAKAEAWDLDSERGKLDLAKDVSSLANWRGGIIIIGATTAPSATYQRNEIQEIHPLQISLAPTDRYSHVVREWIYPVPEGIEFRWHQVRTEPDRGLIGVYVPNQNDELRPFLIAHYIGEAGKRIDAIVGLVQRLGATTKTTPVEELHTFLREGRRLDEIHQKLDTIITKIEVGAAPESRRWMRTILRKIWSPSD
jgi:predicted HTH transcriptional regulator